MENPNLLGSKTASDIIPGSSPVLERSSSPVIPSTANPVQRGVMTGKRYRKRKDNNIIQGDSERVPTPRIIINEAPTEDNMSSSPASVVSPASVESPPTHFNLGF